VHTCCEKVPPEAAICLEGMPRQSVRRGGVRADVAAAAAPAAAPASELERVDGVKGRLATLCTHEVELGVELSELDVQHAISWVSSRRRG
jgi:hypothetical protein